jgi:hypothetical protein
MSSLGEWLDAMVKLRQNKAQVAEFNAEQQAKGMEALGQGIGGLLSGFGKSMPSREDLAYNQVANRAAPPRAVPVDPALANADPTLRPGQIPYSQIPITAQPFTGGKAGFDAMSVLDKSDIAQHRLADQGTLNEARIARMGALTAVGQTDAERRAAELALKQEREARIAREKEISDQQDKVKAAISSYKLSSQKWKDDTGHITDYGNQMKVAMAAAAGAKDQPSYDNAVQKITGTYMLGEKYGFKVAYPEIPQPAFMRDQSAVSDLQAMQANKGYLGGYLGGWGAPSATDIAAQQQKAAAASYMPQLESWNIPDIPERPELEQFMSGGATQPGPSQAASQGPATSAAAPSGGIPTISLQEARKQNPNITPGLKTDKNGNQILVQ